MLISNLQWQYVPDEKQNIFMLQDNIIPSLPSATEYKNSTITLQLLNGFSQLNMEQKIELLKRLERGELDFTKIEIPIGILGNIVETLKYVIESHKDSINIAHIIENLESSKR